VLALVLVGAGGGLWAQRQQGERDAEVQRQRLAFEADLDKAKELRQQARWAEARAVLAQTRQRLGEAGPEDLRQRLEQAAADLDLVGRLADIRLKRAPLSERFDNSSAERDYAKAFRDAGLGEEGEEPEVVAARIRGSAVGEQLVAALDDWAAVARDPNRKAWLLEVARRADREEWPDRFRDPKVWEDRAALEALACELLCDEAQMARLKPPLPAALGNALLAAKGDAVPLLAAAQARWPNDFWLNLLLGRAFFEVKKVDEAVGFYRAALAVRPESAVAHNNLGVALDEKGQLDEAIREYHKAIDLDPKYASPHTNLGVALKGKGQLDQAIGKCHKAIELNPKDARAHNNLGVALHEKGQLDEAIGEYRRAIAIDPKYAMAHNGLGNALYEKGRRDEAIEEYRRAIAIDPKYAMAHYHLGNALRDKGQLDEAIKEYRQALELDPKYAPAHNNLGIALYAKGQLEEAIGAYRRALELDPKLTQAYTNLGVALEGKGQRDEAVGEYRKAIAIDPKYAEAHVNLGQALCEQGKFAEALDSLRTGHELGSKRPGWTSPSAQWVRDAQRLVELDRRLPTILEGKEKPADDAERLALARLCQEPFKKLYASATRFYAEAFANDAKLADGLRAQHRYNAACAAALAGCGKGNDADKLDDQERTRLRTQALDWLRADLAAYDRAVEQGRSQVIVWQRLTHWQKDADLAGLRDKDALAKSPAEEREACEKLWVDVDALLKKAIDGK
jgi:tetratricopeptide (TPR) repeat protein